MRIEDRSSPDVLFLLDACHCDTLNALGHAGTELAATRGDIGEPFCSFTGSSFLNHGYFVPSRAAAADLSGIDDFLAHHQGHTQPPARKVRRLIQGEYEHILRQILAQGRLGAAYFYSIAIINSIALLIPPSHNGASWTVGAIRAENARNLAQEKACLALNTASAAAARALRKLCQAAATVPNLPATSPTGEAPNAPTPPPPPVSVAKSPEKPEVSANELAHLHQMNEGEQFSF